MKKYIVTLALASLASQSLHAVSITAAGIDTLTPPGHVGTDIADLDANGSGQDGFVVFTTLPEGSNFTDPDWSSNDVTNLPAYVTNLNGGASSSTGGWANYDDVRVGGNLYNTGGIQITPGAGAEDQVFTFELAAGAPSSFTLGLLTDNSDNTAWAATNIRIEGPGGITANQSVTLDGASDLANFTIDGGLPGEVYTVHATSSSSGVVLAALTFDSIPEPGSVLLGFFGSLMLLRRKR